MEPREYVEETMTASETVTVTVEAAGERADEIAAAVADAAEDAATDAAAAVTPEGSGAPNPFIVVGAAFVLGVALARVIRWRARAGQ